ncbi:hypothetical protein [Holdemania sp. 1001302B_160321_E10]|uniref:hypothetical protein n=1 Tax=Holdemania sp. 1001302B_160321_E10 TaxID=2787120 RepID=UPI00189B8C22|nr:hypothetical protein [Holdemania sp. 1001302B_160321_E10]
MKINYEKLLEAFGVVEGEAFLLSNNVCKDKCKFEGGKLLWFDKYFNGWEESSMRINRLLSLKLEKLPWKPKDGETVWWICACGECVYSFIFNFRERVLKEMKEVIDG